MVENWRSKQEYLEECGWDPGASASQPGASAPPNSQQPLEDALFHAGQPRSPGAESQSATYVAHEQAQAAQLTPVLLQEPAGPQTLREAEGIANAPKADCGASASDGWASA